MELSLCHKFKFSNPNIVATRQRKPWIFQTQIILSYRIYSLLCCIFYWILKILVCGKEPKTLQSEIFSDLIIPIGWSSNITFHHNLSNHTLYLYFNFYIKIHQGSEKKSQSLQCMQILDWNFDGPQLKFLLQHMVCRAMVFILGLGFQNRVHFNYTYGEIT